MEEGEALEEGEVVWSGKCSSCWWKTIEEVEVVAEEEQGKLSSQEREEKLEEQDQEHPRTGA